MHNSSIAWVCVPVLTLGACADVRNKPFAPPATGETATLVVANRTPFDVYPSLYRDAAECRDRSVLEPVVRWRESKPVAVPAGRELAVTLKHDGQRTPANAYCGFTVSFPVHPGRSYVAGLRYENYRCLIEVLDTTSGDADARKWTRIPAQPRQARMSWDNSGPFCEKG